MSQIRLAGASGGAIRRVKGFERRRAWKRWRPASWRFANRISLREACARASARIASRSLGSGRGKRLGDGESFAQAQKRPGGVAQILVVGIALNVSQPSIRIHQIELGLAVALRVLGHAVQVFEHARDQQLLCAGGAGKLFDGFVQFGEQAVAQLAQVRGARLGLAPLLVGHSGLPQHAGNARHQR